MEILIIFTTLLGFYMAWNIGANDVSNAMGTSVGSKALSLKQAVILAAILEFCGAFFIGSHVSETIQTGIVKPEFFSANPEIFVIGMVASLFATGLWLNLASYLRLPVSTTHAIVGAIIGFGFIIGGVDVISWPDVLFIFSSWIISPVLSGSISYLLFSLMQRKILFSLNPLLATKKMIPYFVFFAFCFFSLSLIYNGLEKLHLNLSFSKAMSLSALVGIISFFIAKILANRIPITSCRTKTASHPYHIFSLEKAAKHLHKTKSASMGKIHHKTAKIIEDLNELASTVEKESEYGQIKNEYNMVEKNFVYLQIISAALVAFAHGANDVANAIGPVSAVVSTLRYNTLTLGHQIPTWILLLGGLGIVVGLATWGWRVIETIGKKITELTPTRGFAAEFSAAITILFASKMGLPISTTHALVGAVLGVGLARGLQALNLKTLKDIVFSWFITIPICAFISIILFFTLKAIFI